MIEEFIKQIVKEPSDKTLSKAKLEIIDWIGYAIAGTFTEQAKPFYNLQKILPPGKSLNLFSTEQLNLFDSTFINASVGNILELDDVHRTSIIHPGDTIIPAAIAAASFKKIDELNFLKAIIAGYEAAIRMGICLGKDHYKLFYSSSTCGVFGASVVTSLILNYDTNKENILEKLNTSIQLSTMNSSGLWQCREGEGEAKQYSLANAARSGLMSAFLAQNEAKAPMDMIEGKMGFLKGFTGKVDYKELVINKNVHAIDEVSNKPWPACRHSHPVIGVSLDIKKEIKEKKYDINNIEKIILETYETAIDFCNKNNPKNKIEAKFSLQHCSALSLIHEEILESFFEENFLNDPSIINLRNKIEIINNPNMTKDFPNYYSASIKIQFSNGLSLKKFNKHAKGDPENPMTEKEICDKSLYLLNNKNLDVNKAKNLIIKILDSKIKKDNVFTPITWFDTLQEIIK